MTKPKMEIENGVYRNFADMPTEFRSLVNDAGRQNLFSSREWFENFIAAVPGSEQPVYFYTCALPSGELALLPMWAPENRRWWKPRTLQSLTNFYTTHFSPLVNGNSMQHKQSIYKLVEKITGYQPGWEVVNIKALDREDSTWSALRSGFKRCGWLTQKYFCYGNWYLVVGDRTFEEYLASRSKIIRKTIANRVRKFDRIDGSRFEIAITPEQLQSALPAFLQLSRQRWQKDEPFPDFLPGLTGLCAEKGWLRLGMVWIDDKLAAAQLWIVKDHIAYIYKVAYDNEFKSLSIGSVATYKLMQYIFEQDDVTEVDYLTGDDAYKIDWMSHRRERWGLIAFNMKTVRGFLAGVINVAGREIKNLLRRKNKLKVNISLQHKTNQQG